MKKCLKIKVSGKVQGVLYREFVQKNAKKLAVEGTIQNGEDGCVLIYACGQIEDLDSLIDALYEGSSRSKVAEVMAESLLSEKDFRGVFRVIGVD